MASDLEASARSEFPTLTDTSTNGTFVNGKKIHKSEKEIKWGDRVEVVKGKKSLCFIVSKSKEQSEGDTPVRFFLHVLGVHVQSVTRIPWQGLARNTTLIADPNDETLPDEEEDEALSDEGKLRCSTSAMSQEMKYELMNTHTLTHTYTHTQTYTLHHSLY